MSSEDAENDPTLRQMQADELAQKGRLGEALAEYMWCWDHGLDAKPAYVGPRGSYLLFDLREFAEQHPPAREALESRRAALLEVVDAPAEGAPAALPAGRAFYQACIDLAALDELFFEEPEKSLGLYASLKLGGASVDPERRSASGRGARARPRP